MKRILACLFIVAVLHSINPQSLRQRSADLTPFATVALAGHINSSGRSECFCELGPDGVCPCCGYGAIFIRAQDNGADDPVVQSAASIKAPPNSESDSGSGVLLFLVALILRRNIGA